MTLTYINGVEGPLMTCDLLTADRPPERVFILQRQRGTAARRRCHQYAEPRANRRAPDLLKVDRVDGAAAAGRF